MYAAASIGGVNRVSEQARLDACRRPKGLPVMHQSWDKLLFLNWRLPVEAVRQLIPRPLSLDTRDGSAWITITPLYIYGARPVFLPPIPFVSYFDELNVRTYVHYDGVPGVWFFSLDANSRIAVAGARIFFSLPYFTAAISATHGRNSVRFASRRTGSRAEFSAEWTIGEQLPTAGAGSLDFFLAERYCLYTASDRNIYRCRIHHQPWPLQRTLDVQHVSASMIKAAGVDYSIAEPYAFCAGPVNVDVWPLVKVAEI